MLMLLLIIYMIKMWGCDLILFVVINECLTSTIQSGNV